MPKKISNSAKPDAADATVRRVLRARRQRFRQAMIKTIFTVPYPSVGARRASIGSM